MKIYFYNNWEDYKFTGEINFIMIKHDEIFHHIIISLINFQIIIYYAKT